MVIILPKTRHRMRFALVPLNIIHLATQTLGFDRCGIFLSDNSKGVLQGQLGVDSQGEIEDISRTVYPLTPSTPDQTITMCEIALGKQPFFLSQNLDGEGYQTEEGDISSNVCVPMKVGQEIMGVLCADNYFSRQSILPSQLSSLMVLANQGANALSFLASQEKIRASLREKEVLLKEIHHRVKNNLQVISSLISLQTEHISDERGQHILEDIENRIRSMALIHENLYHSANLASIDFRQYTESLAVSLCTTYNVQASAVKFRFDVDEILLDVEIAMSCSLILNELISNALKHAFVDGREGEITIEYRHDNENQVTLVVRDNGVGFPTDFDFPNSNSESLGLQVVSLLTQQLSGTIALYSNDGTEFEIRFPLSV